MANVKITDPSIATILTGITDWRQAVDALVAHWADEKECYSSGEVAAALREHDSNLRFGVRKVGEYLRDLFYAGTLANYLMEEEDDDGYVEEKECQPVQVLRPTEGLYPDRTPAGVEVYVYGPTFEDCMDHEFEVFIPYPGGMEHQVDAPAPAPGQTADALADSTGQTKTAIEILGAKLASKDIWASVRPDKRITVPRSGFEQAVYLGGQPLRGGDSVWVTQDGDTIEIHTTDPGSSVQKQNTLSLTRGRVEFASHDAANPFVPGDIFKVEVSAGKLTIDTNAPVNK